MMGGGEMKITELLLAELDREAVGIRKTLERVPELSAQLDRRVLVQPQPCWMGATWAKVRDHSCSCEAAAVELSVCSERQ